MQDNRAGLENGHQGPSSLNVQANGTQADGKAKGKRSQRRPSSVSSLSLTCKNTIFYISPLTNAIAQAHPNSTV